MTKTIKFTEKTIVKKLFRSVLLVSVALGLIQAIAALTEGICISRFVSNDATAALGIIRPLTYFLSFFSTLFPIGCEIICSKLMASGKTKEIRSIFSISVIISVITGIIFVILGLFLNRQLAMLLGAKGNILDYAAEYLKGYFIGAPFFILHYLLTPLAQLDGGKNTTYCSIVTILIVSVTTNILNGLFLKGTFGAGLASSLAYFAGFMVLLAHFLRKKCIFHFTFKNLKLSHLGQVSLRGLPSGAKFAFTFVRSFITNQIILLIGGSIAMTAFSVQAHITQFMEAFINGTASTCLMLSAIFYSEENEEALDEMFKLLLKITLTLILGLSIIYFFCAPQIAILYGVNPNDAELFKQSVFVMRSDAISTPFSVLGGASLMIFQGIKKEKLAYITTILQSFVMNLAMLCLFAFTMRTSEGIWIGLSIGCIIFPIIHFAAAWIYNKKFPNTVRLLFLLPDDFGHKKENSLTLMINNIEDASFVAHKVLNFCKTHNIDSKRSNHLAACAEELAVMTVVSGFTREHKKIYKSPETIWTRLKKKYIKKHKIMPKKHFCEIRISYKNNKLILRVRDDCAEFNIKEKAEKFNQKDPTRNMAIRLIMGLAKNIDYTNILKTNNLIVSI